MKKSSGGIWVSSAPSKKEKPNPNNLSAWRQTGVSTLAHGGGEEFWCSEALEPLTCKSLLSAFLWVLSPTHPPGVLPRGAHQPSSAVVVLVPEKHQGDGTKPGCFSPLLDLCSLRSPWPECARDSSAPFSIQANHCCETPFLIFFQHFYFQIRISVLLEKPLFPESP